MADLLLAIAPADVRSEEQRRRTAVHEVGHAIVGHVTGDTPIGISIVEGQINDGFTAFERQGYLETRENIETLVTQLLAGRAAEEVLLGAPGAGAGVAAHSDLARATLHIGILHLGAGLGDELVFRADRDGILATLAIDRGAAAKVETDLRRLYARAVEIIRAQLPLADSVVDELLSRRYVDRVRFLELAEEAGKEIGNG